MNFLTIGLLGVLSFLLLWASARKIYFSLLKQKELKPNCLLTKNPLVLVTDPVSPWKFWSAEHRTCFRLKEHGYSVVWVQSQKELRQLQNHHHPLKNYHFLENWNSYSSENELLEQVQTWAEQDHLQSIR